MKYEDALKEWGAQKLRSKYPLAKVDLSTVRVEQSYDASFGCETCGYDITSELDVYGRSEAGEFLASYTEWHLHLVEFIKEVVQAGGGTLVE